MKLEKVMKRLIDIMVSIFVLILLSPLLISLYFLIFIFMGRPVFFRQKRTGLHKKSFDMFKFRTMNNDKDANGNLLPDQYRLTPLGSFLRKFSFDELPEFYNILKGDMSLVGPRPLLIRYLPFYKESEQARFTVRPGLTGLAQVYGRNDLRWSTRFKLDVIYVKKQSLCLDFFIALKTFRKVFFAEGVNVVTSKMKDLDVERSRTK